MRQYDFPTTTTNKCIIYDSRKQLDGMASYSGSAVSQNSLAVCVSCQSVRASASDTLIDTNHLSASRQRG